MSGSEVEIYTTHAQLWPRDTMGEKTPNNPKQLKKQTLTKSHMDFFFKWKTIYHT